MWNMLTWRPVGPHSTNQPMEDPPETPQPAPLGVLCPPEAALFLLYSLATLASCLLEAASHGLVIQAAGPCLPPPLSAAWFGHQAVTDVAFMVLLPLILTWTCSGWPWGGAFCHLDPGLDFLAFYASGRLLTRAAADCCAGLLWPAWALAHRGARRAAFWAGAFWLFLLVVRVWALRAPWGWRNRAEPYNRTSTWESPHFSSNLALNQLVFGFGVPLGVLSALHSLLRAKLYLARLTGRPPLLGVPWASGSMLFLCWFPFHLLLLVKLVGTRKAPLDMAEVWVLLRPLGLTLVGASGCLNPLLYACGDQAFRQRLWGALWSGWATQIETQPSCQELREISEGLGQ
ncbi:formyl peptide receptor-related sequence 4-like [Molossus molossus]|uniref:formyl peptide receptor-related sequence 4-like n=1 Tax=Molossus molossus TaxID=27622 RepID=UPI0017478C24|nr:formyl peptide receptor-related sequence 4-like [Molossus molossus]